jgi:hypothetical protein
MTCKFSDTLSRTSSILRDGFPQECKDGVGTRGVGLEFVALLNMEAGRVRYHRHPPQQ